KRVAHVGSSAEATARAGHDDGAYLLVLVGAADGVCLLCGHLRRPRIQAIGTVERDQADRGAPLVLDRFVGHGLTPPGPMGRPYSIPPPPGGAAYSGAHARP